MRARYVPLRDNRRSKRFAASAGERGEDNVGVEFRAVPVLTELYVGR